MTTPLIIFDIDGTLTDSIKMHQDLYATVLKKMDLKKDEEFGTYKHHTDRYIFREIYYQNHSAYPTEEITKHFYNTAWHDYLQLAEENKITEIKGAAVFIKDQLEANSIPYVFATGSITSLALEKLNIFDIPKAELLLAASDDIDSREEIVLNALQKAKHFYRRTNFDTPIIIGDGLWDYHTAQNLGMKFLGIGNNPKLKEAIENKQSPWPDFTNKTLNNLLEQVIA